MKKIVILSFMISALFYLSGCQSIWYLFLNCIVDIAPDRFIFEENDNQLSIPIFTSHPLENPDLEIEFLIIMIHGAGLNAGKAFKTGSRIVNELQVPKKQFMVVAPQFLEGLDPEEKGLLLWNRRWRSGGQSISTDYNEGLPKLSSYEVLDRLIDYTRKKNPTIHHVIILGHSAGGQFISRYAAINNRHDILKKEGVFIQYVVANLSSYLYLDENRYQFNAKGEILKTSEETLRDCQSYNNYKYGLENLYGYAETLSKQVIQTRLLNRPVMFLLGTEDTERDLTLDKSCEVEVQGINRYERGLLYQHHLQSFVKNKLSNQHNWIEIPGVDHDAGKMFTHKLFISKIKTTIF